MVSFASEHSSLLLFRSPLTRVHCCRFTDSGVRTVCLSHCTLQMLSDLSKQLIVLLIHWLRVFFYHSIPCTISPIWRIAVVNCYSSAKLCISLTSTACLGHFMFINLIYQSNTCACSNIMLMHVDISLCTERPVLMWTVYAGFVLQLVFRWQLV